MATKKKASAPKAKGKVALLPQERHNLAALRQTLQMARNALVPPDTSAQIAELDKQIAELDKQLA